MPPAESTGFESAATLRAFNELLFNSYDLALTLIFEGIGPAFTADLFEWLLTDQAKWRYHKGKFVREAGGRVIRSSSSHPGPAKD